MGHVVENHPRNECVKLVASPVRFLELLLLIKHQRETLERFIETSTVHEQLLNQ